jgi:TatD DNase family protein
MSASEKAVELVDSHCHLNSDFGDRTAEQLIAEAQAAGVKYLVTVGVEIAGLPRLRDLSEKHACVFHTAGVHPHEAATLTPSDIDILHQAARHPKCRAIGEIGLDYYYNHSPRDVQRRVFDQQVEVALDAELPIVVHTRDAETDQLEALSRYRKRVPESRIPGVIHCFTGTRLFAEACIDMGFYVSFSGIITFKNADDLRSTAKALPLDRLLVETDSPYLAPIPMRGKKCEPSYVKYTAMKLAEIKGVPLTTVALTTTANARRVFKLN